MLENAGLLEHRLQAGHQVLGVCVADELILGSIREGSADLHLDVAIEELVHLLEKMKIGFFDALDDLAYVTRLFEPFTKGLQLDELSAQLSNEVIMTPDHFQSPARPSGFFRFPLTPEAYPSPGSGPGAGFISVRCRAGVLPAPSIGIRYFRPGRKQYVNSDRWETRILSKSPEATKGKEPNQEGRITLL